MISKSTKEKSIDILIGIGTFILSIFMGLISGVVVLCGGTAWLCSRKANVAIYTILVAVGNVIVGLIICLTLANDWGLGETDTMGLGTIFDVFITGPMLIIVAVLMIVDIAIRMGLQWLTIAVVTKKANDNRLVGKTNK